MSTRDFLAGVIALGREQPQRFLHLMRAGWPEIKAAIDQGHTLKLIHERLVEGGVKMTYRTFTMHVRRLRSESHQTATKELTATQAEKQSAATSEIPAPGSVFGEGLRDPYESIRQHEAHKPPGFHWEEDEPNAEKLY